jgi:tripartite motif-containing protein 71
MTNYSKKYLKYKLKYINLKKKQKVLKGGTNYRFLRKFGSQGNDDGQFNAPSGITQLHDGTIAVVDQYDYKIKIFDSNGVFQRKFGSRGSADGQFEDIQNITQLSNGNIAVCDANNNRIQLFDISGNYLNQFGSEGSDNGQFRRPYGITQLSNGNIAISDSYNHRVQIFDISGNYLSKFGSEGSDNGQFRTPFGITKMSNSNIIVSDFLNNCVQIFGPYGQFIRKFGSWGNADGQFNKPLGIIQLSNSNIAVCDSYNNRIQIFDSNGQFISKFGSEGNADGHFKYPVGIIELSNGDIAVSDFGNHRIQIFTIGESEDNNSEGEDNNSEGEDNNSEGEDNNSEGEDNNSEGEDNNSEGEDYQGEDYQGEDYQDEDYQDENYQGEDYQGENYQDEDYQDEDYQGEYYQDEDYQGEDDDNFIIHSNIHEPIDLAHPVNYIFLRQIGSRGNADGQIAFPSGIAILDNENIAIADRGNDCINIFNINGVFERKFGSRGYGPGQFMLPNGIALLSNGNIAVCDTGNNRIQMFDISGNYLNQFGSEGNSPGQFMGVYAIAGLANGNIAVCNQNIHPIQIFDISGNYLSQCGSYGTDPGELTITALANGNIAVCDSINNCIQIFDISGNYLNQFGSYGTNPGQFDYPVGITQLSNENIAVCDNGNNRVQIFDISGNYLNQFYSSHFTNIGRIAELANGNIVVIDNLDVKIFSIVEGENIVNDEGIERLVTDNNTITIDKFDLNLITKFIIEKLKLINPMINDYFNNLEIKIKLHEDILKQISKIPNILENIFIIKFKIIGEEIGIDAGGITRKVLSNINVKSSFFVEKENYFILNKLCTEHEMKVLGYFWSYIVKIDESLPILLHPLMLLFLTTSWNNYLNIFENFNRVTDFLNSFDTKIMKLYMKNYNIKDNELFITIYKEDEFWDEGLKQSDIECILRESVKTPQGRNNILLKKMKYDFATSLKTNLETFKSSLFKSLGKDISDIGIKLISRILSGDPDITWDKILPYFSIEDTFTNYYPLATQTNKKLIMDIIKSEIKSHPDYPEKLFEVLTGARVMSSSQNYKLRLVLTLQTSDRLTNYHTCFGWVEIKFPDNFNSLSETEKKNLILLAIGYDAIVYEIQSKINQAGGNIIVY